MARIFIEIRSIVGFVANKEFIIKTVVESNMIDYTKWVEHVEVYSFYD